MGQGGFIFAEWDSIKKEYPDFQRAFADLEAKVIDKCLADWSPRTFGGLTPNADQFGRTSILPALFDDNTGTQMVHWRQYFASTGHQTLISGTRAGNVIPEDFKVAWIGLMFPNKQMTISEIRWQTSDRKYVRLNIEELRSYNKPAIIFEEGFLLDEEQSFELYGYVESVGYQRIVMLGACYYRVIDKVLGAPGSAI